MIQALVLLFIGADVLILYVWHARQRLVRRIRAQWSESIQPTGTG